MEHQEVDLSAIHQPILQLTTVISKTCTSKTIEMKIFCVFLQLIVLESIVFICIKAGLKYTQGLKYTPGTAPE